MRTLLGLPAGVEKVGVVQFDGHPARVWWGFPNGVGFDVHSTNLEGGDIQKTPYSYRRSPGQPLGWQFAAPADLLEKARRLVYRDGSIYQE